MNILFTKNNIPEKAIFTKTNKINLELQIRDGFALTDLANQINSNVTIFPLASIRILIPVGLVFFNPVFQTEFNFFYKDSKLLLPFTVETGFLGKYNIHRFEFGMGFLVGALFSPGYNNAFQVDSASIKPLLQLGAIINTSFKIIGEFGYRYYVNDSFINNWKIDLKGIYFSFGFGVNF